MFKDKMKELVETKNGNSKKQIENLVFLIIILIATIIGIKLIWSDNSKKENEPKKELAISENSIDDSNTYSQNDYDLKKNLETTLSKLSGVEDVEVLITYSQSSQIVPMYNENQKETNTEETDKSGGVRKITSTDNTKDVVYKEENGVKEPITEKIITPKIEGAVIIAKGASNANVKSNIVQAVEALTGLATHKIQVFEMN